MFQVTLGTQAIYIAADPNEPKEIINLAGAALFYKTAKDVDSGDTELAAAATVEITQGTYFVSASKTEIGVRALDSSHIGDDLKVSGDAAIAGAATVTGKTTAKGELEVDGDLNHDGTKAGFFGTAPDVRSTKITKQEAGADAGLAKVVKRVEDLEALLIKLGLIKETSA